MNKLLETSAIFLLSATVTGCASTAKGVKNSVVNNAVPQETLKSNIPDGSVLAVIRYPAVVDESAKETYHEAFSKRAIGGKSVTNTVEVSAVAESVIVKSNYFALSLYKELAAKLPEHGVLLSPHIVKLGADGELTSEPMTSAEKLPSVVSVDFATYSFPDGEKIMGNVPVTFGDLITPLVTVRTDHRAAVPTQGVLLASRPLVSHAAAEGREAALRTIDAMQRGDLDPVVPELDFVSYITSDTPYSVSTQNLETRSIKNAAMVLPVEKVRVPSTEMTLLKGANDGTVDVLDDVYTDALSRRIVALINGVDTDKAVMMGKAASIAKFDPSLAALTFVGRDDADYASRAAYAERLLEAERKYLSVQSLRIFDSVHNGVVGTQVRDMISQEQDILERRRKLAREQNLASFLAVASVGAGVAIGSDSSSSQSGAVARSIATRALIQSGIFAAQEAFSKSRISEQIGANYLSSITPALEQQTEVTVYLLDSNETITAIRYEDLQAKLQTLYASQQRSLDTVATQCAYLDENGVKSGTWLGVCDGGLANGSGAGVLKTDSDVIEYYGYTRDGLADGPGLMIRHTSDESVAYEGSFSQGRPNGSVRVSKAGQKDETLSFIAGMDKGRSLQTAASPFAGRSGGAIN